MAIIHPGTFSPFTVSVLAFASIFSTVPRNSWAFFPLCCAAAAPAAIARQSAIDTASIHPARRVIIIVPPAHAREFDNRHQASLTIIQRYLHRSYPAQSFTDIRIDRSPPIRGIGHSNSLYGVEVFGRIGPLRTCNRSPELVI